MFDKQLWVTVVNLVSVAEPSRADSSQAEPCRAVPSLHMPLSIVFHSMSCFNLLRKFMFDKQFWVSAIVLAPAAHAEPSRAESSRAEPCRVYICLWASYFTLQLSNLLWFSAWLTRLEGILLSLRSLLLVLPSRPFLLKLPSAAQRLTTGWRPAAEAKDDNYQQHLSSVLHSNLNSLNSFISNLSDSDDERQRFLLL